MMRYKISSSEGSRQNLILIIDEDDDDDNENDNAEDEFSTPSSDISVIIVTIADTSTMIVLNTNATIVMSTHPDIQYRIVTMLIIIEASVFNHSRGIMLQ